MTVLVLGILLLELDAQIVSTISNFSELNSKCNTTLCVCQIFTFWLFLVKRFQRYRCKISTLTFTVSVRVKLVDHAAQLLVADVLPEFSSYSSQVPQTDLSRLVIIKQLKGLHDLLLWVSLQDAISHCGKINIFTKELCNKRFIHTMYHPISHWHFNCLKWRKNSPTSLKSSNVILPFPSLS